jgi:hypothetical protein
MVKIVCLQVLLLLGVVVAVQAINQTQQVEQVVLAAVVVQQMMQNLRLKVLLVLEQSIKVLVVLEVVF